MKFINLKLNNFVKNIIASILGSAIYSFICKLLLIDYFNIINQHFLFIFLIFLLSFIIFINVLIIEKNIKTLFHINNLFLIVILISSLFIIQNYVIFYENIIVIKGIHLTDYALDVQRQQSIYDDKKLYEIIAKVNPYNIWKDVNIIKNIILGLSVLLFIGIFNLIAFVIKLKSSFGTLRKESNTVQKEFDRVPR